MSRLTRFLKTLSAAAAACCLAAVPVFAEAANPPVTDVFPIEQTHIIVPDTTGYGEAAYAFLETLTSTWPERLNEENNRSQSLNDAGLWIKGELEAFGYTVESQDYTHFNYTGTNYYTTKPGTSDKIICIGAHYDCVNTTGTDDNGSGVSVLLELAQRFADIDTPCTLQFVFFDNEEYGGFVGSYNFVNYVLNEQGLLDDVLCFINLDSVGAGDRLYAYSGVYDEADNLTQIWPLQLAQAAAGISNVSLCTLPEEVASHPDAALAFRSPTRIIGSDHYYFMTQGIPYLYFEAGLWCNDDGTGGNSDTHLTCHYQTANPAFASTGGQIMHTEFDNLQTLNQLLPGRVQYNLTCVSLVVSSMLMQITEQTPLDMEGMPYTPSEYVEPTTAAPEPEVTLPPETTPSSGSSDLTLYSNHSLIIIIFSFAGAVVILLIGFVIYTSSANTRRKKRRRRLNNSKKKKKNRF